MRFCLKIITTCAFWLVAAKIATATDLDVLDNDIEKFEMFLSKQSPFHALGPEERQNMDETIRLFLVAFSAQLDAVDFERKTRALGLAERVFTERFGLKAPALAIRFLSRHAPTLAREIALGGLYDSNADVVMASACVVLEAGEWDIAAPILDSLSDFRCLTSTNDPRAEVLLRRAIEQRGNPDRRVSAAYYLGYVYGDWAIAVQSTREEVMLNRNRLSDLGRLTALRVLRNGSTKEDVISIAGFSYDPQPLIIDEALGILANLALGGNVYAEETLHNVAAASSDDMKALIVRILKNLKDMKERE